MKTQTDMKSFVIYLGFAFFKISQVISFGQSNQKHYLVLVFDAESSQTSLEELAGLLNSTAEKYFELPKVLEPNDFNGITTVPLNGTGFCVGESEWYVDLLTVKTNQTVKAVFYGCTLHFKTDAKIIMVDEMTLEKGVDYFKTEEINWKYKSTFCKCVAEFDLLEKRALRKELKANKMKDSLALLAVAAYVGLLLLVLYVCRIFSRFNRNA